MKKILALLLSSMMMLTVMVSCNNDSDINSSSEGSSSQTEEENTVSDSSESSESEESTDGELTGWAYIEDKGTLIVGLDDTFAPMGFRDENGDLVGLISIWRMRSPNSLALPWNFFPSTGTEKS